MRFITQYSKNIINYDFINKFQFKKLKSIPKIDYVNLYFNFKKSDIKLIVSALLALEVLTFQKGSLILTKSSNISLKLKKGNPIGCKVTLRKNKINLFILKLLNTTIPKQSKKILTNKKAFSFKLNNILNFSELEKNYQFFKNLLALNITIKLTTNNIKELNFLLKSLKLIT